MAFNVRKQTIEYRDPDSGRMRHHYVLIADTNRQCVLLSHANLYLAEVTSSSLDSSKRYSTVISQFYNYIATQTKFKKYGVHQYHVVADNRDIRRWQVERQIKREREQSISPTSETIYGDAKQLLLFFGWLKMNGYTTNVKVGYKTWKANFKNKRLLSYITMKARRVVNGANIEVLDKHHRQKKLRSLINDSEIRLLIDSFPDPVYSAMFKFCLATAMRPMDLCKFPYVGSGENIHIMPFSDMGSPHGIIDYAVLNSKGNKDREIKINARDLQVLEIEYIIPLYHKRKKLYEMKYKRKCPPRILFLNKTGDPVTPERISNRTLYAVQKARSLDPSFRKGVDFYQARHWWPTQYLLKQYAEEILTTRPDVLNAAAAQVLTNQMGHSDISTTFKYYVDIARIIAQAYHGKVSEIISESESIMSFIARIERDRIDLEVKKNR